MSPLQILVKGANLSLLMFRDRHLTHSFLEMYLTSVCWTCQNFENNFEMKHKSTEYGKERCR